jgi:hypothetical protein
MASKLERVVFGDTPDPSGEPSPVDSVFVEGVVKSVSAAGMKFTLPDLDDGKFEYGPAPYPRLVTLTTTTTDLHTHDVLPAGNQPVKGDRCLAVFTGGGPWVIGWWPNG